MVRQSNKNIAAALQALKACPTPSCRLSRLSPPPLPCRLSWLPNLMQAFKAYPPSLMQAFITYPTLCRISQLSPHPSRRLSNLLPPHLQALTAVPPPLMKAVTAIPPIMGTDLDDDGDKVLLLLLPVEGEEGGDNSHPVTVGPLCNKNINIRSRTSRQ